MAYLGSQLTSFDPTRSIPAPRDADRFSGNGSTTSFTLSRSVSLAVDIEVFVENVQQEPLTAYDVNGTSLNFTGAPPSGTNNVYVVYRNFQSGAQVTMPDGSVTYSKLANNLRIFTTDNLTPNGNNSVFTLSEPPADANTVMVTVDGIIQRAPVHYTTSGSTITFSSAPAAGSNVHVRHLGFRTTATVTQLAANSTISQPTISSPTISGTALTVDQTNTKVTIGATSTDLLATRLLVSDTSTSNAVIGVVGQYATGYFGLYGNYPTFSYNGGSNTLYPILGYDTNNNFHFTRLGTNSQQPAYLCRAWVNFNGSGTVSIRGSGNVSSITDLGVGAYNINYTTAMPDTNYNLVGTCHGAGGATFQLSGLSVTTGTEVITRIGGTSTDVTIVCASVFR